MSTVEAVKTSENVNAVEAGLQEKGTLYADVWKLGLNTALRIQDLLSIRYDQIDWKRREYCLHEGKTEKRRVVTLNDTAVAILNRRQRENPDDLYVFQSHDPKLAYKKRKGIVQPVSVVSVSRHMKSVGDALGLRINTHSMRKTRGYAMHKAGRPIEAIMKMFNHTTPGVTLRYIGIEAEDIAQSYYDFEL